MFIHRGDKEYMKKTICFIVLISILILGTSSQGGIINLGEMDTHNIFIISPRHEKIDTYDMVIIAPMDFSSSLQPLINHKNTKGVHTFLKTLPEIYDQYQGRDNAEKIKFFIKETIENSNIRYVLLVGGANLLPGRYTHIYYTDFPLYPTPDEWIFLSDLYYADIYDRNMNFSSWDTNNNNVFGEYDWYGSTDDMDLYPDVYLGRLPCMTKNEVSTCVNKIISYETGEAYKQEWFHNLVVIGGDSLPGDSEQVDEGEYVQEMVIDIMTGFIPIKIWASNEKLYQVSNINQAINGGAGFVFFNGHGNLDLWATHPHEDATAWIPSGSYRNSHINTLSNKEKLPIIISDACYHCTYNIRSDCFGWTFITNTNGGAIAFLGGTDIDLSYGGTKIITKGIEKLCIELSQLYQNGATTLGELWGNSLAAYLSPVMDHIDIITVMEFHSFGDPSLMIASESQPPTKPETPKGSSSGEIKKEYIYSSISTDPDGDQIYYMFEWGDEEFSGWMGPYDSGEMVEASHNWTKKGIYEIRVLAKDEHGVTSEWSDPIVISMPKKEGIGSLLNTLWEGFPWLCSVLHYVFFWI